MSTYVEGQTHQLLDKLEAEGFTAEHITKLGQCGRLADVRAFLEGKAEIVMKKVEEAAVSLLTLVKTVVTPAIAGKKTSDCFTNKSRYYYRDSNLDARLPKDQPSQTESKFLVQKLSQNATFKQAVESFLGVSGEITVPVLAQMLKSRGHVTTLPVIESLIEQREAGEDVDLRTDGRANFFFVKNKNAEDDEEGSVSVVYVLRRGRPWGVGVGSLGRGFVWFAAYRFFFRN
jgi:hypothetical protein